MARMSGRAVTEFGRARRSKDASPCCIFILVIALCLCVYVQLLLAFFTANAVEFVPL